MDQSEHFVSLGIPPGKVYPTRVNFATSSSQNRVLLWAAITFFYCSSLESNSSFRGEGTKLISLWIGWCTFEFVEIRKVTRLWWQCHVCFSIVSKIYDTEVFYWKVLGNTLSLHILVPHQSYTKENICLNYFFLPEKQFDIW